MTAALYASIWLALVLFVAGEAGKRTTAAARFGLWSPWALWTAGALLCAVHMAIAMGARHGWSHADAIRATAAQTEAIYGVRWGGGVFVNYAFTATWMAEALWWRVAPRAYARRPVWARAGLRAFYLLILFNAGVIFVPPARRPIGLAFIAAVLWAWRPPGPKAARAAR